MKRLIFQLTLGAAGLFVGAVLPFGTVQADETTKPAVSGPNGKISAAGGVLEENGAFIAEGSLSFPITHQTGIQLDGLAGTIDGDGTGGGALQVFWRDPDIGLVGAYGSALATTAGNNYTIGNVGVQAAYYFEDFTFEGVAGLQLGDSVETDAFGSLTASVYLWEDLKLSAGYRYWFGEHGATAGAEWQFPNSDNSLAWSIFADGRLLQDDDLFATVGVRVYFGENKSLKRRHREDDPTPLVMNDLNLINRVLAAAGNPAQLPPFCTAVDEGGNCSACQEGYFLNEGNQCEPFTTEVPTDVPTIVLRPVNGLTDTTF